MFLVLLQLFGGTFGEPLYWRKKFQAFIDISKIYFLRDIDYK